MNNCGDETQICESALVSILAYDYGLKMNMEFCTCKLITRQSARKLKRIN